MSFGAIIAMKKGPIFVPVDFGLECALTEVRVEQKLDERTSFALRFQEDYENDKPTVTEHEIFKNSIEIAILVPDGPRSKNLICLVRGQIEQLSFDVAHGGPGSSFEARGQDVRTILDRVCAPEELIGPNSAALIPQLISDPRLEVIPAIEPGAISYVGTSQNPSIKHVGTKLELIEWLARNENQCVWLSYSAKSAKLGVSITTTFNVKASPPRGALPPPPSNPFADKRALRVLTDSKECPNVANFKTSLDHERVKIVRASALDDANGAPSDLEAKSADDKFNDGPGVDENGDIERSSCITAAGGPTESSQLAEKMATDESWFIKAEALTSASMYQGVLQPHELITVIGVGCEWAGQYQVEEVTHVINAAEHWMNVTLRSNSRGEKKL